MDNHCLIKEGDNIMLQKETCNLKLFKVWKKRKVFMDKKNFFLDAAIGQPYGTVWEVQNDVIVKIQPALSEAKALESDDRGGDNRNIVDDTSTQKLSREDISSLKESGHSGESIIEQLVENSATYKEKSVFSQAKYRKRKRDKHLTRFQIVRPSTRLLCEMYWNRAPSKIIQLRADTLAQILTAANIQSNTKVMLVETTQGLLLGAIMERLAGKGTIVQFHSEDQPVRLAVDHYNFPKSHHDMLHTMLLSHVGSLLKENHDSTESMESASQENVKSTSVDSGVEANKGNERTDEQTVKHDSTGGSGDSKLTVEQKGHDDRDNDITMEVCKDVGSGEAQEKDAVVVETAVVKGGAQVEWKGKGRRKIETPEEKAAKLERQQRKQDALNKVKSILQPRDMDALVIVCKFQPSPILMALIQFLSKSRRFVVYCSNKEPLMECYMKLRERGGAIDLRLTETWLRNHQVLPERTHPLVTMSGTGGYLLTGTNVEVPQTTMKTS